MCHDERRQEAIRQLREAVDHVDYFGPYKPLWSLLQNILSQLTAPRPDPPYNVDWKQLDDHLARIVSARKELWRLQKLDRQSDWMQDGLEKALQAFFGRSGAAKPEQA